MTAAMPLQKVDSEVETQLSNTVHCSYVRSVPTERIATGCQGGPDNSLSSVLLYIHVLYEGDDVRV